MVETQSSWTCALKCAAPCLGICLVDTASPVMDAIGTSTGYAGGYV